MHLDELRSGDVVSQGNFRLDEQRAREKLRNFQLANPHYYVLQFIKAAHILGASWIQFSIDTDELEMTFDGVEISADDVADLYSAAFITRGDRLPRALRHLAIGANAAHAIGLSEFVIEVGGKSPHGVTLTDEESSPLKRAPLVDSGTRIYLRKRVRPALLLRFVDKLRDRLPEAQALREKTVYSSIPIFIDDQQVSSGMTLPEHIRSPTKLEHQGQRGVVGFTFEKQHLITDVLHHGVLIDRDTRPAHFGAFGARAVVDSPWLSLDLSHSAVVEDHAWDELQKRVDQVAAESMVRALAGLGLAEIRERRVAIQKMAFEFFSRIDSRETSDDLIEYAVRHFGRMPLFDLAIRGPEERTRYLSIEAVRTLVNGESALRFSNRHFEPISGFNNAGRVLRIPSFRYQVGDRYFGPSEFVQFFADNAIDVTNELEIFEEREKNRRRWQLRPWSRENVDLQDVRSRNVGNLEVVVGNRRAHRGIEGLRQSVQLCKSFLRYVKDGHILSQKTLPSAAFSFDIEIAGELEPTELFDGPANTEELKNAHITAAEFMIEKLHSSAFSLGILGALLGQFHEELSRAFHWKSNRWPKELVESPFGVAPALVERKKLGLPGKLSFEETVKLRLGRLGSIANQPVAVSLNGENYSLRDIYRFLVNPSTAEKAWMIGEKRRDLLLSEDDRELVLVVVPRDQWVLTTFFVNRVVELKVQLHKDLGWEDEEPSKETGIDAAMAHYRQHISRTKRPRNPTEDSEVESTREREMELLSRLSLPPENRLADDADSVIGETIPPAPSATDKVGELMAEIDPGVQESSSDHEKPEIHCEFTTGLIEDIRRYCPPGLQQRFADLDEITVIKECGREPVHLLGTGQHIILDRGHPLIKAAFIDRADAVARAFACLAIYSAVTCYDIDHGVDLSTRREIVERKQRFLRELTRSLEVG